MCQLRTVASLLRPASRRCRLARSALLVLRPQCMYEIEPCGMFDCACMCESLVIDVSDTNMCSGRVARAVWLKPLPTLWPRTVTVRICARVRISRPRRTCILPCTVTHIHMCMLHCARTPLMMHSFYDGPGVFVMRKKCVHDVVRAIVMETRMCVQCMAVSAHVSLSHVPHDSQC